MQPRLGWLHVQQNESECNNQQRGNARDISHSKCDLGVTLHRNLGIDSVPCPVGAMAKPWKVECPMNETEIKSAPSLPDIQGILLSGMALLCAVLLVSPATQGNDELLAKIGFTVLLAVIAIQDLRTRTVSPAITLPWMVVAVARAVVQRDPTLIPFWIGIFCIWSFHFYGGGDAKLLMGLFGLWPHMQLLWVTSAVLIATGLPILIYKYARVSPRVIVSGLAARFSSGGILPKDEELDRGIPFAFAYCLSGALYLWIFQ